MNIYDVIVRENEIAKAEEVMHRFGITQDDWDRSKAFNLLGERVVQYTITCSEETYKSIVENLETV